MQVTKTMFHGSVMGLKSSNFQTLAISNSRIWTAPPRGNTPFRPSVFKDTPKRAATWNRWLATWHPGWHPLRILRGVSPFFRILCRAFTSDYRWVGPVPWPQFRVFWGLPRRCKTTNFPHNSMRFEGISYHPWDWYIYLHEWLISMVNVGTIYHTWILWGMQVHPPL